MINFFKNLFGPGIQPDFQQLVAKGAVILDVRTEREFKTGHIKGSVNMPLDKLVRDMRKLKKNTPLITCCASGMRSSTARNILRTHGFAEVYNGGSWISVRQKLK